MGIPPTDIQVLSPTRKGETGTRNLNAVLQKALNPPAAHKKEKKYGEITFREGDRVMQIRNNYDIIWAKPERVTFMTDGLPVIEMGEKPERGTGVYNGDVGVIAAIDNENEMLTILYDDRLAAYGYDMLSELEHAFAMTIHKSQGSEYRAVVLLALDGPPQLMEFKKFARSTICGSRAAFSMMVLPCARAAAIIMFIVAPTETLSR